MSFKYQFDLPLDDPNRTVQHGEIIRKKRFTRELYTKWYAFFERCWQNCPKGLMVELGAGAGFFKNIKPDVITSDIMPLPGNDMAFSALEMPFEDQSLGGIFMIDTFHHIPNSQIFLQEASRCLKPKGRVCMVEPANSLWGRFVYQNFHHEPFLPNAQDWTIPSSGPLSGANGALPWIVFERDKTTFNQRFPEFEIKKISYINPITYLISGGVSYRQLLPDFSYPVVAAIDGILPKISPQFSMFMHIELVKNA